MLNFKKTRVQMEHMCFEYTFKRYNFKTIWALYRTTAVQNKIKP